jgi:spore coat protein A
LPEKQDRTNHDQLVEKRFKLIEMKRKTTKFYLTLAFLAVALFGIIPSSLSTGNAQTTLSLLDSLTIPKWENQLTNPPPIFQPNVVTENGRIVRYEYEVTMSSFKQQILPPSMNLLTTVWGYGGVAQDAITGVPVGYVESAPGPTFETIRGIPAQVKWINNIATPFLFPVDPTIHWANPNGYKMSSSKAPTFPPGITEVQTPVPLVPHLHGGQTQSYYDGTPDQWFTASGQHGADYSTLEQTDPNAAIYYYNNDQLPTTLWYHDHALGVTRLTVNSGLEGFYIIRETNATDSLVSMLPSGRYEMPLMIQDRTFTSDGSLWYPTVGNNPSIHPYWDEDYLGDTIIVNGKSWPEMNVDQGQYRFRLLDASNSRIYILSLEDETTNQTLPFTQIGSDGGYLRNAANITSLTISPAERADILVDFSGLSPGTTVLLKNTALLDQNPSHAEAQTVGQILRFVVTEKEGFTPKTLPDTLNTTLEGSSFPNLPAPSKTRILTLNDVMGPNGATQALLNGQLWSGVLSEAPVVGSTEDWTFVDLTPEEHTMHLHLVQFQLLSRQSINVTKYQTDWINLQRQQLGNQSATPPWPRNYIPKELPLEPYLIGDPVQAIPSEQGWKDTILVYTGQAVTIRVRFASQDGSPFPFDAAKGPGYVWHCHLLEHEDNEMMRPYRLIAGNGLSSSLLTIITPIIVVVIVAIVSSLMFIRRRNRMKERIQSMNQKTHTAEESPPQEQIESRKLIGNTMIKVGLTIVLVSWLIYTAYWTYKYAAYTPNIKYNVDVYSSLSLIFLTVGSAARTVAGVFALVVMGFVWRGKWSLTARRFLIFTILLEAFYLISYFPTVGVGPHIGDIVITVEATIPSFIEAIAVPVPLFVLAYKLTKGEKGYGDAVRWGCIAGVSYLFVLWVRFSVQWFATFIQTPNYNPFDDIGLPGHGILYVLNYPLNMFEFILTLFGFLLLCFYSLWALFPSIRAPGTMPSMRRVGFILLLLGAYVITIAGLFGIFGHVGGHSIWSEFFAIHNVDRWFVSLPLLAIPLILYEKKKKKSAV